MSYAQNGVFFSAASCKKGTIFGAAQTKLGPSYFVRALDTQVFCIHFILSALSLAFKNIVQVSSIYQSNDKNIDLFSDRTINMPHCFLAPTISLLSLTLSLNWVTPWKVWLAKFPQFAMIQIIWKVGVTTVWMWYFWMHAILQIIMNLALFLGFGVLFLDWLDLLEIYWQF